MKEVLTDILNRTLAPILSVGHPCLAAEQVSRVEDNATLKTPIGTALIVGTSAEKKEPVAVLVLTFQRLLRMNLAC